MAEHWQFFEPSVDDWLPASTGLAALLTTLLDDGDPKGRTVRLNPDQPDTEDEDVSTQERAEPVPDGADPEGDSAGPEAQPEIVIAENRKPGDLLGQIVDEARREEIEKQARRYAAAADMAQRRWWIANEVHRLENGGKLNWDTHPFLPAVYQDAAIDGVLMGSAQFGKPQPCRSRVHTPDGWKFMGDLKVGDLVSTPDGSEAPVAAVFEKGRRAVYRLRADGGASAEACEDHRWPINGAKLTTAEIDEWLRRDFRTRVEPALPAVMAGDQPVPLRRVIGVDSAGEADCRCIMVDHPDHLYITDNYLPVCNSEWMICDIAASAAWGLKVLVVISKYDKRDKFAAARLDPCFKTVKWYKRMVDLAKGAGRTSDSTRLKHFGDGSINLVAATADRDFTSYAADKVDIDEHQECDQENLAKVDDRMSGSPFRFLWRIGHPDIEGTEENQNLDWLYQHSDRRKWHVPCGTCGQLQVLDWWNHVIHEVRNKHGGIVSLKPRDNEWRRGGKLDMRPVCIHCHRPMNRLSRKGEWVVEDPEAERHGYKLSNLYNANKRLAELFEQYNVRRHNPALMKEFVNKQLGETFTMSGSRINDTILQMCSSGENSGIAPYRFVPAGAIQWKKIAEGQAEELYQ